MQQKTTTTVTAPSPGVVTGASATFTATVTTTSGYASGTVTFSTPSGNVPGCVNYPIDPSTGSAPCTTSFASAGSVTVTATFNGTSHFGSSSGTTTVTVQSPAPLYADPKGTGTVCTSASPCTLTTALSSVASGGTVYVNPGAYQGNFVISTSSTISRTPGSTGTYTLNASGSAGGCPSGPVGTTSGNTGVTLWVNNGVTAEIDGVVVSGGNSGTGGFGSGIVNGGTLTLDNTTVCGNIAGVAGYGAGIANSGTLTMSDSTVTANAAYIGGGVYNQGNMTIESSTVAGNTALGVAASGPVSGIDNAGTLTIQSSTVAGNTPAAVAGIFNEHGDMLTLTGSLVADSCFSSGTAVDDGYNGFAAPSTCLNSAVTTDVVDASVSSDLGNLADNGGPTQTILPSTGNKVFGAIPVNTSVTVNGSSVTLCPTTDQRGVASSAGQTCAIGAVQIAPPPSVTAVSPTFGPPSGGTTVTITGTGFTGASAVSFGTVKAATFTVTSDTSITAKSPACSTACTQGSPLDITVTTQTGTSKTSSADRFTYGLATAYVANVGDGTVSVVDLSTNSVVETITVGGDPGSLAISQDGRTVYVADKTKGVVSVIDAATGTVTSVINVATSINTIAVTSDGKDLYVAAGPGGSPLVSVYSTSTGAKVTSFDAFNSVFTGGVSMALSPMGDQLAIGAGPNGGPIVNLYPIANDLPGTSTNTIPAFPSSFTGGVTEAYSPDGTELFVSAGPGFGPVVDGWDPTTGAQITPQFNAFAATYSGGVTSVVAPDGSALYVMGMTSGAGIAVFALTNGVPGSQIGSISRSDLSTAITFGPGGSTTYVTDATAGTVLAYPAPPGTSPSPTSTITVGKSPDAIAIAVGPQAKQAETTFYADPTGSPTATSCPKSAPCTLVQALAIAPNGATIYLAPGKTFQPPAQTSYEVETSVTIETEPAVTSSTSAVLHGDGATVVNTHHGVSATIEGVQIIGGSASPGGGVDNRGTLTIENSTVGNNTGTFGGGIFNYGILTITGSTIVGNTSRGNGGGIYNAGPLTIENSTIADNQAGVSGGGIYNVGTLTLETSTIAGNAAHSATTVFTSQDFGSVTAVADIFGGTCIATPSSNTPWNDLGYNAAPATGLGCLDGTVKTDVIDPSTSQNQYLNLLADNGGPTKTMLPVEGNKAIGAIPVGSSVTVGGQPVALCPTTDQRGIASATGEACTIGSVQVPVPVPTTITLTADNTSPVAGSTVTFTATVSSTGGTPVGTVSFGFSFGNAATTTAITGCTALQAHIKAHKSQGHKRAASAPHDATASVTTTCTIAWTAPGPYSVTATFDPSSTSATSFGVSTSAAVLVIVQTPPALYADPKGTGTSCTQETPCALATALSTVNSGGTIYLEPGTFTGPFTIATSVTVEPAPGTAGTYTLPGQVTVNSGTAVTLSGVTSTAGQLDNKGTLTVTGMTFTGDTGEGGGAIHNSGTLTVTDSTISKNIGIDEGGAIYNSGTLTVTDSTIFLNVTAGEGGAIYNSGTLTVTGSTISGNSAPLGDSGIFGGTVTVSGSILADQCSPDGGNVTLTDAGYNAVPSENGCVDGSVKTDVVDSSVTSDLGSLADNGGPTKTMLPTVGNKAIGAVPANTTVTVGSSSVTLCPTTDQRGNASPTGQACTIGAVQTVAPPPEITKSTTISLSSSPQSGKAGDSTTLTAVVTTTTTSGTTSTSAPDTDVKVTFTVTDGPDKGVPILTNGPTDTFLTDANGTATGALFNTKGAGQDTIEADITDPVTGKSLSATSLVGFDGRYTLSISMSPTAYYGMGPPDNCTVSLTDPQGKAVPNASVTVVQVGNPGVKFTGKKTDTSGEAVIPISSDTSGIATYQATYLVPASGGNPSSTVTSNELKVTWRQRPSVTFLPPSVTTTSFSVIDAEGILSGINSGSGQPQSTVRGNATTSDAQVTFAVVSGPDAGLSQVVTVDSSGSAVWVFANNGTPGLDHVTSTYVDLVGVQHIVSYVVLWAPATASPSSPGYVVATSSGGVTAFGSVPSAGSPASLGVSTSGPVVDSALTPDGQGYWLVSSLGGVYAFGDAGFFGAPAGLPLVAPIVGITPTPDGAGYWLVASDGGVFAYGDASFFGSTGAITLAQPIVGIGSTPDGAGYWLVASDGGVFSFGDAVFSGSGVGSTGGSPVVGIASAPGGGYWVVTAAGKVLAFGGAGSFGDASAMSLAAPVVALVATADGQGYWLIAADGGVFGFGDAPFLGSAVGKLGGGSAV